jgi:hypothetical protein
MKSPPGTRVVAFVLAVGGLASVLLSGCSSSKGTLDSAAIERAIAASIVAQRHVQTTVRCPANVPRKAGLGFTCVAKLDVGAYPIAVIQTDNTGNVRYGNQAPLVALDVAKVQQAIAKSILTQRKLHATVTCPATVLQQAGLRFTCMATVNGHNYPFEVTQVNANGQVKYVGR